MAVSLLCGLAAVSAKKVREQGPDGCAKILAYTVVVGFASAMNNTNSKLLTKLEGTSWFIAFLAYICIAAVSGGFSAKGCTVLNNAVSVPLMSCVQVLVNGLSGIFIWGDAARVDTPLAYSLVYVYFFLGIYLCSDIDHGQDLARWHLLGGETDFVHHRCQTKYGQAMDEFFVAVKDAQEGKGSAGAIAVKFDAYVAEIKKHHVMEKGHSELFRDVLHLASKAGNDKELARILARWLGKHSTDFRYVMDKDPAFAEEVRQIQSAKSEKSDYREPLLRNSTPKNWE